MDSLPKGVDKGLLQELECPVCMEYMVPPITMCENGHNICPGCRPKLDKCPTCNTHFLKVRNLALESLSRQAVEQTVQSQPSSLPEKHKCPFASISNEGCVWSGSLPEMKDHIKKDHGNPKDSHEANGSFNIILTELCSTQHYRKAVFALGELFYIFWVIKDSQFYCAVLYVGDDEKVYKFRYKFSIFADGGAKIISMIFPTQSILDDLEDVLQPAECILLPYNIVEKFVNENKQLVCEFEISSLASSLNSTEAGSEVSDYVSDPESNESVEEIPFSKHGRSRRHHRWGKHEKGRKHDLSEEPTFSMKSSRCAHGKRYKHCKMCRFNDFVANVRATLDTSGPSWQQHPGQSHPGRTSYAPPSGPFRPHFPHFGPFWPRPPHSPSSGQFGPQCPTNPGYQGPSQFPGPSSQGNVQASGGSVGRSTSMPAATYCEPSISYVASAEKCDIGFKIAPSAPDEKSLYPDLSKDIESSIPTDQNSSTIKPRSLTSGFLPGGTKGSNTPSESTWKCTLCGQMAPKGPGAATLHVATKAPTGSQWLCKMCGQLRS